MKLQMSCLVIAVCIVSLQSCDEGLSHNKAQQIVTTKYTFPITESEVIEHGIVASTSDSLYPYYYDLQKQGLLMIEPVGPRTTEVFGDFNQFRVTLTEEGKKYVIGNVQPPKSVKESLKSKFKTCQVHFVSIQDVLYSPDKTNAKIQFTVERKGFTPFWAYYTHPNNRKPDTIQTRTLNVVKEEDGWKSIK